MNEVKHYSFYQNKDCEYFPCHEGIPVEEFNCLFCYCPLYTLGEQCRGNYEYLNNGIKSCEHCTFPHLKENYMPILERFPELSALAAKKQPFDCRMCE